MNIIIFLWYTSMEAKGISTTDERWLTVKCCDKKELDLHWHIWGQFALFTEYMALNQKAEKFELKYTSQQMCDVIDMLNLEKREEVYAKYEPLLRYLAWDDHDVDVINRVIKKMKHSEMWKDWKILEGKIICPFFINPIEFENLKYQTKCQRNGCKLCVEDVRYESTGAVLSLKWYDVRY